MILCSFQNVVKEYNGEGLFQPVSFDINSKDCIGLIGPNGGGKSTIVKLLIGQLIPEQGNVVISKDYKIGYLSQEVISSLDNTLYEEALLTYKDLIQMEKNLNNMCQKLADNYSDELASQYAKLEEQFSFLGGYNYKYKIDMMLSKFLFKKEDYSRKISSFSGGEKMKVAFIKLLLINPDLLILDEPTNHLDIDTIEWLEEYLKSYQGAILFVSHDKYFISSLANKIMELEQKHLEIYNGNYDYYSKEKKIRYEQKLELYKRQQQEAKKLEWFIKFYMPKPRFASRAHDREKKLARLEKTMIDKPILTRNKVNMNLDGYTRKGKHLLKVTDLSIGYSSSKVLIEGINFTLYGNDKLAIMGQNGSGKTTFIKCLLNQLKPISGEIDMLTELNIGYLKQDGINISSDGTIFDYIKDRFPQMLDQEVYDHLGKYNFSYEDDQKIVNNLSGGEKMRVVFAELVLHKYNLLILDEPTNHLDMFTKQELIDALVDYEGTLITVSHDRYFVDSLCNRLLYFEDNKAYLYEGRYSDFKLDVLDDIFKQKDEELLNNQSKIISDNSKPKYVNKHEDKKRPRLSKNKIEDKLLKLEEDISKVKSEMEKEENYSDFNKMNQLEAKQKELEHMFEEYMDMLALYED